MSENPPDPFHGCDSCRRLGMALAVHIELLEVEQRCCATLLRHERKFARWQSVVWCSCTAMVTLPIGAQLGQHQYGAALVLLGIVGLGWIVMDCIAWVLARVIRWRGAKR